MIVAKFGGTSVGDADAIARTAGIVRARLDRSPVVVTSALAGTTNRLIEIGQQAASGQLIVALTIVEELRARHFQTIDALGVGDDAELISDTGVLFDELAHLAEALSVLGDCTPRSLDAVSAMGERLSAPIVAAALARIGVPAVFLDARRVMATTDDFGRAEPRADEIAMACRAQVLPLVRDGKVPVLGGYIGATAQGVTTTLGRGGSDYSASLLGAAMDAEAIEIWTDVDGMLTADPRVVPAARLIEHIRFDEAAELASFGAKVLHPSTIAPAGPGDRGQDEDRGRQGALAADARGAGHDARDLRGLRAQSHLGRRRRHLRGLGLGHARRRAASRGDRGAALRLR